VTSKATDGRVEWNSINSEQREMVALYSAAQDAWQEVCLVLDAGSGEGGSNAMATECVVINRPIARSMSAQLADLLLNGAVENRGGLPPQHDDDFKTKFMRAFGEEAAVYVGGPEKQGEIGLVVHGFDLPGAVEVAPGTRIFTGGVEAVVESVLDGTHQALDFRWFVGRRADLSTADSAWLPIACARPVALKQCLGLPKPLWHEVMELCGGAVGELSKMELLKRTDLDED